MTGEGVSLFLFSVAIACALPRPARRSGNRWWLHTLAGSLPWQLHCLPQTHCPHGSFPGVCRPEWQRLCSTTVIPCCVWPLGCCWRLPNKSFVHLQVLLQLCVQPGLRASCLPVGSVPRDSDVKARDVFIFSMYLHCISTSLQCDGLLNMT